MKLLIRTALAAAVAGSGLLLAAPASAQDTGACAAYPNDCVDGGGGGTTSGGGGGALDGAGEGSSLPVTGGELVLMTAAGSAALAAGTALTVAGRRRRVQA